MKNVEFEVYIGLSDITDTEQFQWVDGAPLDFTNWNSGEPNEAGGEVRSVKTLKSQAVLRLIFKMQDFNCWKG